MVLAWLNQYRHTIWQRSGELYGCIKQTNILIRTQFKYSLKYIKAETLSGAKFSFSRTNGQTLEKITPMFTSCTQALSSFTPQTFNVPGAITTFSS